jgi:hypothetical protein
LSQSPYRKAKEEMQRSELSKSSLQESHSRNKILRNASGSKIKSNRPASILKSAGSRSMSASKA